MKQKMTALILSLTLFLSGCGTDTATTTTAAAVEKSTPAAATAETTTAAGIEQITASWQQKTDPVTLTFASAEHKTMGGLMWKSDPISRQIADMTGVDLVLKYGVDSLPAVLPEYDEEGNLIPVNTDSFYEVMVASGEYTDLLFLTDPGDVNFLATSGDAAALDELSAQYCPDFWNDLDPLELLYNTESDGHVYALRNGYNNSDVYRDERIPLDDPYPLALRSDILQQMGEKMPTSIEELDALLYRVKEKGGEYGITIPFSQFIVPNSPLTNWMGIQNTYFINNENGTMALRWDEETQTVKSPLGDESWRPYLLMLNRWYRDGILTLTARQHNTADVYRTFAQVGMSTYVNREWYMLRNNANTDTGTAFPYQFITEPLTYEGEIQMKVPVSDSPLTAQSALFISDTCTHKDRAILFYQFLRSDDGAKLTHWGIEGTHYNLDENGYVVMTEGNTRDPRTTAMYGLNDTLITVMNPIGYWDMVTNPWVKGIYAASPQGMETNADILAAREMLIESGRTLKKFAAQSKFLPLAQAVPQPGDPDYSKYAQLRTIWEEGINEVVLAPSATEAEDRWSRLQNDLLQADLHTVERAMTQRFLDVLKRYQQAGFCTDIVIE